MDAKIKVFWTRTVMMQRGKFSREFKFKAVKLVRERGLSMTQAAIGNCGILRAPARDAESGQGELN